MKGKGNEREETAVMGWWCSCGRSQEMDGRRVGERKKKLMKKCLNERKRERNM